jgi:hypothetical protein
MYLLSFFLLEMSIKLEIKNTTPRKILGREKLKYISTSFHFEGNKKLCYL